MRWLRLDDGFPDHPKVCGLSPHAAWLFVRGLCYCSRFLTDGHIPEAALRGRLQARRQDVAELVESGLWHAHDGDGVDVHDYLEHQPSRSKVEADRVATAQRLQVHRERKRNANETPFQSRTGDGTETSTTLHNTTQQNISEAKASSSGKPDLGVRRVFDHWRTTHNHKSSKLDDKRRRRIEARIREGFTEDQLCRAISNAKNDPHLMGENETGMVYDGIQTLLRDAAQVERLEALTERPSGVQRVNGKPPGAIAHEAQQASERPERRELRGGGELKPIDPQAALQALRAVQGRQ